MIFTQCSLLYTSKEKYEKDIVSMEIIPPVAYAVPWTTPGPLIAFLGTGGNWLALLVGFLCLGVATMIYLPFVIAANKVNNMATNG